MQIESRWTAVLRIIKKIVFADLLILTAIGVIGWWWQWPTVYTFGRAVLTVSYMVLGFGLLTLTGQAGGFSERDQRTSRDLLMQNPRQFVADSRLSLNFSFTTILTGVPLLLVGYYITAIS